MLTVQCCNLFCRTKPLFWALSSNEQMVDLKKKDFGAISLSVCIAEAVFLQHCQRLKGLRSENRSVEIVEIWLYLV